MYTIILLSVLAVVGILLGWLLDRFTYNDTLTVVAYFIGGTSFAALCISLSALINIDRRFDNTVFEYETFVNMVNSYDGQDYGNMNSLVEKAVGMNCTIANHKAHYDSKWTGLWHSERIAKLEPITFNSNKSIPVLE